MDDQDDGKEKEKGEEKNCPEKKGSGEANIGGTERDGCRAATERAECGGSVWEKNADRGRVEVEEEGDGDSSGGGYDKV